MAKQVIWLAVSAKKMLFPNKITQSDVIFHIL